MLGARLDSLPEDEPAVFNFETCGVLLILHALPWLAILPPQMMSLSQREFVEKLIDYGIAVNGWTYDRTKQFVLSYLDSWLASRNRGEASVSSASSSSSGEDSDGSAMSEVSEPACAVLGSPDARRCSPGPAGGFRGDRHQRWRGRL